MIFSFYILNTTFPLLQKYSQLEILEQQDGAMEVVYDGLFSGNALEAQKNHIAEWRTTDRSGARKVEAKWEGLENVGWRGLEDQVSAGPMSSDWGTGVR